MTQELKRLHLTQTNRPVDVFQYWRREGYLELNPPYQRGDVWGPIRQRNLIRSILMGIPIPSVIVNDRFASNWGGSVAVIDGKQRITAILKFIDSELKVPAAWFGVRGDINREVEFQYLPDSLRRRFCTCPIAVSEGRLASIEDEIEVFELVNFGGVPQGMTDDG